MESRRGDSPGMGEGDVALAETAADVLGHGDKRTMTGRKGTGQGYAVGLVIGLACLCSAEASFAQEGGASATGGAGSSTRKNDSAALRDELQRFVDGAQTAFAHCDLSLKTQAYTQVQHDAIATCLERQVSLREQAVKGLEEKLAGRDTVRAALMSFMNNWRRAVAEMPPKPGEDSTSYTERKAKIREDVAAAANDLTADRF